MFSNVGITEITVIGFCLLLSLCLNLPPSKQGDACNTPADCTLHGGISAVLGKDFLH